VQVDFSFTNLYTALALHIWLASLNTKNTRLRKYMNTFKARDTSL